MAKIPQLSSINKISRDRVLSLTVGRKSVVNLTTDELSEVVKEIISEQLGVLAQETVFERKERLQREITVELARFKKDLKDHINDRMNNVIESMVRKSIDRNLEFEIERRVVQKIKELKKDGKI